MSRVPLVFRMIRQDKVAAGKVWRGDDRGQARGRYLVIPRLGAQRETLGQHLVTNYPVKCLKRGTFPSGPGIPTRLSATAASGWPLAAVANVR